MSEEIKNDEKKIIFASYADKDKLKLWVIISETMQFNRGQSHMLNLITIDENIQIDRMFLDNDYLYAFNFGEIMKFKFNEMFEEIEDLKVVRAVLNDKDVIMAACVIDN